MQSLDLGDERLEAGLVLQSMSVRVRLFLEIRTHLTLIMCNRVVQRKAYSF
jgi:hypothetical protein